MAVVSIWSRIDAQIEYTFAHAIGVRPLFATKLLHSIDSLTVRSAVIKTAIEESAGSDALALFSEILKNGTSSKNARNSFSHHIWGCCDALPEALLLINAKYFVEHNAGVSEDLHQWLSLSGPGNRQKREEFSIRTRDHGKIVVYRKGDFDRLVSEAVQIHKAMTMFSKAVPALGGWPADGLRSGLLKQNLIRPTPENHTPAPNQ